LNLGKNSEMIIFESLLTTLNVSVTYYYSQCSIYACIEVGTTATAWKAVINLQRTTSNVISLLSL